MKRWKSQRKCMNSGWIHCMDSMLRIDKSIMKMFLRFLNGKSASEWSRSFSLSLSWFGMEFPSKRSECSLSFLEIQKFLIQSFWFKALLIQTHGTAEPAESDAVFESSNLRSASDARRGRKQKKAEDASPGIATLRAIGRLIKWAAKRESNALRRLPALPWADGGRWSCGTLRTLRVRSRLQLATWTMRD